MERLDRIEASLDRLVTVVDTLAGSVAAHDSQVDALIRVAEKQAAESHALDKRIDALRDQIVNITREWQAYLPRMHPRQEAGCPTSQIRSVVTGP